MAQFRTIYPGSEILSTALRGAAAYGLSRFDVNLWAYAEAGGIPEIISEDFEHGRHYGKVRVVDDEVAQLRLFLLLPAYQGLGLGREMMSRFLA